MFALLACQRWSQLRHRHAPHRRPEQCSGGVIAGGVLKQSDGLFSVSPPTVLDAGAPLISDCGAQLGRVDQGSGCIVAAEPAPVWSDVQRFGLSAYWMLTGSFPRAKTSRGYPLEDFVSNMLSGGRRWFRTTDPLLVRPEDEDELE